MLLFAMQADEQARKSKLLFYSKYGKAQYIETHCPWIVSTSKTTKTKKHGLADSEL